MTSWRQGSPNLSTRWCACCQLEEPGWLQVGINGMGLPGCRNEGPIVITPDALSGEIEGPTIITGEMTPEDRQVLGRKWKNAILTSPASSTRHPAMLAELGWQRWQAGQRDDPVSLSPIYLHVAEAIPE